MAYETRPWSVSALTSRTWSGDGSSDSCNCLASSIAWAALGLAEYRLHRRREAEADLRRALKLDPNDIYAQSAMVVLLQEQRQDDRAEALADLLAENPGTPHGRSTVRCAISSRSCF